MKWIIQCAKHERIQNNIWKHDEGIKPILDVGLEDRLIDADTPEEAIALTIEYMTELFALNAMEAKLDTDKLSVFDNYTDFSENKPFLIFDHFSATVNTNDKTQV